MTTEAEMDPAQCEAIIEFVTHAMEEKGAYEGEHKKGPIFSFQQVIKFIAEVTETNSQWWYMEMLCVAGNDGAATLSTLLREVYKEKPDLIVKLMKAGGTKFYMEGYEFQRREKWE